MLLIDTYGGDTVSLDSYEYYDNYKFIRCDRTADMPLIDGVLIAAPISALDQPDNVDGYLIMSYVRVILQFDFSDVSDIAAMDATITT